MDQYVRRLTRSRSDRWVAGVCGGIGAYARIDPTLVRLGLIVVSIFTALAPGVLAYLAAWVVMPDEPAPAAAPTAAPTGAVSENGA